MAGGVRNSTGQQIKNRRLKKPFWLIILSALFLLAIWSVVGPFGIWKLERTKMMRDQLKIENEDKAKTNTQMEQDINKLKSDQNYQKQIIRKDLGYVKDGEIVYKFIKNKK